MVVPIGPKRHLIDLQSVSCTSDGMGGQTDVWSTPSDGTVWASIWPISAIEQVRAGATTMIGTHRIRIRYYEGIKGSWRVKFVTQAGTRYFAIVSVMNINEMNRETELLCREVLA